MAFASRRKRVGATLVELMVALVVLSILGAASIRLFVSQSGFVDQHAKQRSARTVSRASMNLLLSELRMVEPTGGIVFASPNGVTFRVPYAMGLTCGTSGVTTSITMLPADSATLASASFAGYAWRDASGDYTYVEAGAAIGAGDAAICSGAGYATLAAGRIAGVSPAVPAPHDDGVPIMLFQRIRYDFAPSLALPGRRALWRTLININRREEIAAPFDSSARFRFYHRSDDTSTVLPPLPLRTIRGIELVLAGASETPRRGGSAPEVAANRTAVFFTNALNHP